MLNLRFSGSETSLILPKQYEYAPRSIAIPPCRLHAPTYGGDSALTQSIFVHLNPTVHHSRRLLEACKALSYASPYPLFHRLQPTLLVAFTTLLRYVCCRSLWYHTYIHLLCHRRFSSRVCTCVVFRSTLQQLAFYFRTQPSNRDEIKERKRQRELATTILNGIKKGWTFYSD